MQLHKLHGQDHRRKVKAWTSPKPSFGGENLLLSCSQVFLTLLTSLTSTFLPRSWAALIVVAGFGYFTVKSNNTAKKREYMIKQGQQLREQREAVADGDQPAATSNPVRKCSQVCKGMRGA